MQLKNFVLNKPQKLLEYGNNYRQIDTNLFYIRIDEEFTGLEIYNSISEYRFYFGPSDFTSLKSSPNSYLLNLVSILKVYNISSIDSNPTISLDRMTFIESIIKALQNFPHLPFNLVLHINTSAATNEDLLLEELKLIYDLVGKSIFFSNFFQFIIDGLGTTIYNNNAKTILSAGISKDSLLKINDVVNLFNIYMKSANPLFTNQGNIDVFNENDDNVYQLCPKDNLFQICISDLATTLTPLKTSLEQGIYLNPTYIEYFESAININGNQLTTFQTTQTGYQILNNNIGPGLNDAYLILLPNQIIEYNAAGNFTIKVDFCYEYAAELNSFSSYSIFLYKAPKLSDTPQTSYFCVKTYYITLDVINRINSLTSGADSLISESSGIYWDDYITGEIGTLNDNDSLDAGSGFDTLSVKIDNNVSPLAINNFEVINFVASNSPSLDFINSHFINSTLLILASDSTSDMTIKNIINSPITVSLNSPYSLYLEGEIQEGGSIKYLLNYNLDSLSIPSNTNFLEISTNKSIIIGSLSGDGINALYLTGTGGLNCTSPLPSNINNIYINNSYSSISSGSGNDVFYRNGLLNINDRLDGGNGENTLSFTASSLTGFPSSVKNFQNFLVTVDYSNIILDFANVQSESKNFALKVLGTPKYLVIKNIINSQFTFENSINSSVKIFFPSDENSDILSLADNVTLNSILVQIGPQDFITMRNGINSYINALTFSTSFEELTINTNFIDVGKFTTSFPYLNFNLNGSININSLSLTNIPCQGDSTLQISGSGEVVINNLNRCNYFKASSLNGAVNISNISVCQEVTGSNYNDYFKISSNSFLTSKFNAGDGNDTIEIWGPIKNDIDPNQFISGGDGFDILNITVVGQTNISPAPDIEEIDVYGCINCSGTLNSTSNAFPILSPQYLRVKGGYDLTISNFGKYSSDSSFPDLYIDNNVNLTLAMINGVATPTLNEGDSLNVKIVNNEINASKLNIPNIQNFNFYLDYPANITNFVNSASGSLTLSNQESFTIGNIQYFNLVNASGPISYTSGAANCAISLKVGYNDFNLVTSNSLNRFTLTIDNMQPNIISSDGDNLVFDLTKMTIIRNFASSNYSASVISFVVSDDSDLSNLQIVYGFDSTNGLTKIEDFTDNIILSTNEAVFAEYDLDKDSSDDFIIFFNSGPSTKTLFSSNVFNTEGLGVIGILSIASLINELPILVDSIFSYDELS
jgi:hypothetical protein